MYENYKIGKIDNGKLGFISVNYEDAEIGQSVDILIDCPDGSGRKYTERGTLVEIIKA